MPKLAIRTINTMLVADCPQQRDALHNIFAASPYLQMLHVMDTEEAGSFLTAVAGKPQMPDLVILDLPDDLPSSDPGNPGGWGGFGFLQQVKSQSALRGMPLVILGAEATFHRLPVSPDRHLCSCVKRPSDPAALAQMAIHFGEYWGTVVRVPPQKDESENNSPKDLQPSETTEFESSPISEWTSGRPVEILVIDDNNDDATLFQESLAEWNQIHVTQVFEDGETALAYLRQQGEFADVRRPDLVVMDIHMPQKTGLALLQEIKADQELRHLPVVMLTASRFDEDIWEAYSRGASGFVEKPARFEWFRELAKRFANYWSCLAHLPPRQDD